MRILNALLLLLIACSSPPPTCQFQGQAMEIPYTILIGHKLNSSKKKRVEQEIHTLFLLVDEIYNNWNPRSEISFLSELKAHQKVVLSKELMDLLHLVDKLYGQTEGRFDITVAPLALLWKSSLKSGHLPPAEQIDELRACTGWDKVHLEGDLFWKDKSEISFDLGGIAKGYAVDLLLKKLSDMGYHSLYVEWGGEIATSGEHPDKRPWKVGIEGSDLIIESPNLALATSGHAYQGWTIHDTLYTHIVDPKTGIATTPHLFSTTVAAKSCAVADAFATTLFLFPTQESIDQFMQRFPDLRYWLTKERIKDEG